MFALARVHKGTRDVLEVRRTFPCEREDTLGNSLFSFSYTGNNKQHPLLLLLLLFLRSIRAAWLFFPLFSSSKHPPTGSIRILFVVVYFLNVFLFLPGCVCFLSRLRDFCFSYFWRHSIRETVANPMLPFSPCSPRSLKSHEYILRLHAIRRKRFSFPPFWVDSSELRGPNGILKIHSSSLDNQMLTEWFVMGRNDAMFFGCTQNK
jgi:hypothetical protein